MKAEDVTDTLDLALKASGLSQAKVVHRPRLLSDNGSSYISADLAKWLDGQDMEHVRGAPYHPMTQGKIERWHQTLKNRILRENYYLPGDLEAQIEAFVAGYNDGQRICLYPVSMDRRWILHIPWSRNDGPRHCCIRRSLAGSEIVQDQHPTAPAFTNQTETPDEIMRAAHFLLSICF
jgi:Integrase core domain